ncbi:TPA: hypothetical protein DCX66_04025 [Candidatus Nomurabacteria bacterium]|uniref:Uncharacterized protein n=1 Tax=Candidatus Nomurabacteria bacterium GW2011_GWE1_35_16 TaxID=1618761 RepID=A0A0G0BA32_9BACT|nr:MAG: hypothetical protein UR55_C0012G0017 [Candidatus Nomurabacteria bacterium GW2011_GWF1_34_20]KKP62796.1 MAG: hypothetical protein UR57_C0011G0015 [Candidatus Nomurabacteria bacterium GW2011_GWE2_34_25]KKP66194.1 MAG: hypothetical protein UR64_C0011G0016 [Candidatus Nomurabacteria bacterium GW2011_GWE1_35_16]HAE36249.1 hypothetical protein [Candidatus Nomurabacteria bacterium]HAX65606.1 hypothetical protein [Candidatus Nomurabacteria bacterium]
MENKIQNYVDWKRISRAVDHSTDKKFSVEKINDVILKLQLMYDIVGSYSQTRSMLSSIGEILLNDNVPNIYVPVCPDYSHINQLYTMEYVSNGVSLVAQKHIDFLLEIRSIIPSLNVIFLIADQECYDSVLCNKMGISTNEFRSRIIESNKELYSSILQFGWKAEEMSKIVPDILSKEQEYSLWIGSTPEFSRQIDYDTYKRDVLYKKINPLLSWEDKRKRTVHTAAQYYCLGKFTKDMGALICNHTTTNLAWYLKTGVALIENPIIIY